MTKVYATLGPSSRSIAVIEAMLMQGMDGVRINLSHAGLAEEEELIQAIHKAFDHCEKPVNLIIDLQGPELRVGAFENPLELVEGSYVSLAALKLPEEARAVLAPGKDILVGDGQAMLTVADDKLAFVKRGGTLSSRKSIAIPATLINMPASTESDKKNIALAAQYGVTGVMQPFVRDREELRQVRQTLDAAGGSAIKLYAKIETAASIGRLPEFMEVADEVVVARGDLGNTLDLWNLPAAQKRIAALCNEAGCPFMVATQLISSMKSASVPTRAEVSDIFNAVLDGAESVMATDETAVGGYPVEVVRYMVNIVKAATAFQEQG